MNKAIKLNHNKYDPLIDTIKAYAINLLKKIKWKFYFLFYGNQGYVSLGDLFYVRDKVSFIQYILVARFLDIERYRKNQDRSFYYTNALSRITGNVSCYNLEKEMTNNNNFINLIQSVDQFGYDEESKVLINGDYYLANGTHRAALCLNINKHIIPALFIGGDIYFKDSFIAQLESTAEGRKIKKSFDTKLLEVEELLKSQHVLCSCIIPVTIRKSILDLIKLKISEVSKFINHYHQDEQGNLYIGFLPKKYDYTIRHGKLYFMSILKLKREIEKLASGCQVNAGFIDGERSLEIVNTICK